MTTLNQCLLKGDVVISYGNRSLVIPTGMRELENVDWIFHDGIGYVFPTPTTIDLMNHEVTGSWWNISKQTNTPKENVTKDVFKLWLDHGKRPSDATYEYIVVPSISLGNMEHNASKINIKVIANTPELQAVMNKRTGIFQAIFYKGGEVAISEKLTLFIDHPGIVMLKINDEKISEISVSDPNRELSCFHLSVSAELDGSEENFGAVWDVEERVSRIYIELPQDNYAGESVTVIFK